MSLLQIYLRIIAANRSELERVFNEVFAPAISEQNGFRHVFLLKVHDKEDEFQIQLCFDTEDHRLAWVASAEHQEAFPQVKALCESISHVRFELCSQRRS